MSHDRIRDLRRVVVSVAAAIAVAVALIAGSPTGVHHTPDVPTSIHPYDSGLLRLVNGPGPHPL